MMKCLPSQKNDEKSEEEVSLYDLKQNLHVYAINRLRNVVVLLINLINEFTTKKDVTNYSLDIFLDKNVALISQMYAMEKQMIVLESDNLELRDKLRDNCVKGKSESSSLQLELETSMSTSEMKLVVALERSNNLQWDLVGLKEELEQSFKWTTFSKMPAYFTSLGKNDGKGLESVNILPPYSLHRKYVSLSDNMLCLHCGPNVHLKKECPAWKRTKKCFLNYSKWKIYRTRDTWSQLNLFLSQEKDHITILYKKVCYSAFVCLLFTGDSN